MKNSLSILLFTLLLSATLGVHAQVYNMGNTGETSGWFRLGTLTLPQHGYDAELRILGGVGYNAMAYQLGSCNVHFKTSNTNSEVNGFYGAGIFSNSGRSKIVNQIRVIQINQTTWQFYAFLSNYTGEGTTLILNSKNGNWVQEFLHIDPPMNLPYFDLVEETVVNNNMIVTGNLGLGVLNPTSKLAVNGNIRAKEINVENANWPDYVFAKSYYLPTLQETEKHIKENGHLPGIPSAAEVKTNGVDLGEMNAKLLQKIEELTLHLIEIKKENQEIKDQIKVLLNK